MLIILWNSLNWSSPHSTDSKQSRQHWPLANNAGNEHLPKATSTKELPNASIEEDIEQHDQDSPPLEGRFKYHLEIEPDMLRQLDQRLISNEQLVAEVKGIYAGLVVVEAKCIEIDEKQLASAKEKDLCKRASLQNHQWQSLIALHKQVHIFPSTYSPTTYRAAISDCFVQQLLHEHHDFLLACQHPSGSPALSELVTKYSMPTRFWCHGIQTFLEVLRHRLPQSFEFMLTFIYIAYSMIALLYETTSGFQDTWIECLGRIFFVSGKRNKWLTVVEGDLARYRMAIEDDKPKTARCGATLPVIGMKKQFIKARIVGVYITI